eukprot:642172-Rhodomonas_salina.1
MLSADGTCSGADITCLADQSDGRRGGVTAVCPYASRSVSYQANRCQSSRNELDMKLPSEVIPRVG